MKHRIITCPEWGARHPKQGIVTVGRARRIIFHHTASHVREISNPKDQSVSEACRYARDIQNFHMGPSRGWIDSGHNFLVLRRGIILQGRWLTVSAIEAGHMVQSAHCPGQNEQIGIEHEHISGESMPQAQREASAWLMGWISKEYKLTTILPVDPHSKHYATACPDSLKKEIPAIRRLAAGYLV